MARLIKKDGRLFVELPESLQDKKIKAIKLEPEIFVLASEDAIKRLIDRQLRYVITKRVKNRLVENKKSQERRQTASWNEEYAVFSSDEAARTFAREHAAEIKSGEILGVHGFDGKYYVVRARTYAETLAKIEALLKNRPASVKEIASALGLDENLVKAVLEIAKEEEGIVYEGKDGRYHYAG